MLKVLQQSSFVQHYCTNSHSSLSFFSHPTVNRK